MDRMSRIKEISDLKSEISDSVFQSCTSCPSLFESFRLKCQRRSKAMLKRVSIWTFALLVVAYVPCVRAQQPKPTPAAKQVKTSAKKAGADESDPLAEVQRITAVSLVNTLADDARMFHDPLLRARVQARA